MSHAASTTANFSVEFVEGLPQGTTVKLQSRLDQIVKFDLYISPDQQRYLYTSSCAVFAGKMGFENWPQQFATVAVANPRILSDVKQMTCD